MTVAKQGFEAMWSVLGNVLLTLVLSAAIGVSVVLFVIAHQDDSRAGKVLAVLMAAISISMTLYIVLGQHWL
jgi:hypothetical protein